MAWDLAASDGWITAAQHPYKGANGPDQTLAIIYWTVNQNNNTIIDIGEHAVLSVAYSRQDRPHSLDHVSWEISTPKGAPMTVDRTISNISTEIVDLG